MKDKEFSKLVASIKEAGQVKHGYRKASRVFEITPPSIKAIRKRLNLSQSDFALMIGVSISTLPNWEQGRREPEGPAKALLKIASKNLHPLPIPCYVISNFHGILMEVSMV